MTGAGVFLGLLAILTARDVDMMNTATNTTAPIDMPTSLSRITGI